MSPKTGCDRGRSISLRCYAENDARISYDRKTSLAHQNHNKSTVLVFSTHTTQSQRFSFGTCGIWVNDTLQKICLFHDDDSFSHSKIEKIKSCVASLESFHGNTIDVMSRQEFVSKIFYPHVYFGRAACVGFDIPFEISRLSIHYGKARNMQNGFSFKLSENLYHPNIRIKSINGNASFVQFASPIRKKSEKKRNPYRGFFVDVKTLHHSVTNKSSDDIFEISDTKYDSAKTRQDSSLKNSIRQSICKTIAIHEIYQNLTSQLASFFLLETEHAGQLYSPASLAKKYLEKLGIRPFLQKNPEFPKEVLGFVMSAYYGGRTEVRIRKKPVKVTYLDFTSMYPTMFVLLGMNRFLTAERIIPIHSKKKTQEFLDKFSLKDIKKQSFWSGLSTICKIRPDNDILPVRSDFGAGKTQNIGVNLLKSTDGTSLWYALPDVMASKILSGKTPIIEDAITFVPQGMQDFPDDSVELVKDVTVNPARDDFVKLLIQKRLQEKDRAEDEDNADTQNILKIIANAASYGIYIQVNSENTQSENTVHGLKSFDCKTSRTEHPSRHFHPIIAILLTSAARLVLAAAEKTVVQERGGYMAYCDTDSVMVSPQHARLVQEFFSGLNPYDSKTEMFKIEKDENKKPLEDIWFYGISSKRYVLYNTTPEQNIFDIRKHSLHGLGHLLNVDSQQWWHDILEQHYNPNSSPAKYDNRHCISKIAITTPYMLERLSNVPKIRPFDTVLIGTARNRVDPGTGRHIIPTVPYRGKDRQDQAPFMPFSDYNTGRRYPNGRKDSLESQFYWSALSEAFSQYCNHPESKSSGDVGRLHRLKIRISESSVRYIGKESHNLDESSAVGINPESYVQYHDIAEKILSIRPGDSWRMDISRSNLMLLQKRIRQNRLVNLHNSTLHKILKNLENKREVITA